MSKRRRYRIPSDPRFGTISPLCQSFSSSQIGYNSSRPPSIPKLVPNQRAATQPQGTLRNRWIEQEYGCAGVSVQSKLEMMGSIKEIEEAVLRLSAAELAAFRAWFTEFDAAAWDRQIEDDVAAGRLDALADEAIEDLRTGRCTER
jgi:hypothetical protein